MRLKSLAAALFFTLGGMAAQAFETPLALLEAFYAPYFTDDFAEDESRFRSAELNALYQADLERTPAGEMGALGFDPYIDGQDYALSDLEIGAPVLSGDSAVVEVRFSNFGRPTVLTYELVRESDGWKIDDVVSGTGEYPYRLSEIFAAALEGE